MTDHQGFEEVDKRLRLAGAESVQCLRVERVYAVGDLTADGAFKEFSAPSKLLAQTNKDRADLRRIRSECRLFLAKFAFE